MNRLGIIEGFFGPSWSWEARNKICQHLGKSENGIFLYAPKEDPYLRKRWQEDHPDEIWESLSSLRKTCRDLNVQFGVGLSPFELYQNWDHKNQKTLENKIEKLNELQCDVLGVFFDDMKSSPGLAKAQIEIVHFIKERTRSKILFCPTFYSFDPILDKVFGKCPENYLKDIGEGLKEEVEILWTGLTTISKEITSSHLSEIAKILKRKPFIWDNMYANDGPKNCKKLMLKPFSGRNKASFEASSGWLVNPMNQPGLSLLMFRAIENVFYRDEKPQNSFEGAFPKSDFGELLYKNHLLFLEQGLDEIVNNQKNELIQLFSSMTEPEALEVSNWLKGHYIVDSECLTN